MRSRGIWADALALCRSAFIVDSFARSTVPRIGADLALPVLACVVLVVEAVLWSAGHWPTMDCMAPVMARSAGGWPLAVLR